MSTPRLVDGCVDQLFVTSGDSIGRVFVDPTGRSSPSYPVYGVVGKCE